MRSFFQRDNAQRDSEPATPSPSPSSPARPAGAAPKASRGGGREVTRIARGSTVVGEISGTAELVIEGKVDGEIDLDNRVVVGPQGEVDGKIVGAAVEVGGKVVGNVLGRERVEVLESGKLEGDVTSPRVVIAEGAFFKGKVEMTSAGAGLKASVPTPAAAHNLRKPPPAAPGGAAAKAGSRGGKASP